jgi:hypothetical protein
MHIRTILTGLFLCVIATGMLAAADCIWIEGEAPSQNPLNAPGDGGVEHPQYLSEGKWLKLFIAENEVAKKVPAEGALVGYDFEVKTAGKYEVWNRFGWESIRSAFDWKIDDGAWKTIPPGTPYMDMMDAGVWCELLWVHLGDAELTAGKHNLQIRVMPSFKEETKKGADGKETTEKKPQRLIYVADCFCLSLGEFHPDGKHKPGEDWMTEDDKKAAAQVFEVKSSDQPGSRVTAPLAGLWQVCRFDDFEPADRTGPDKVLPEAGKMPWSAIPVPSNKYKTRPDLTLAHRLVYRTRVKIPAELAGHSFFVHFPSNNMITSVFANGKFCGWTKAMIAPWDCDISVGIKPGEVNEIAVVIKDTYYGLSPQKSKSPFGRLAFTPYSVIGQNWIGQYLDFPVSSEPEAGILGPPSLVACGGIYAADVFAKPSVKKKELALEITLKNTGAAEAAVRLEIAVEPFAGGAPEKVFAAKDLTVAAGQELVVNLAEAWANPKFWWPDDPQQYYAVTKVSLAGKPVDILRTKFGFREWEWNSSQFKLNGIPWHGRDDGLGGRGKSAEDTLRTWREKGQTMMRYTFGPFGGKWCGLERPEALDVFDREGMVVRLSGIFNGMGGNYLHGLDQALFDNWTVHLEQWTKAYRNHPSILIWSIENEIVFINSRNLGQSKKVEPMVAKSAQRVMEVDPTRPVMVDGGRCLIGEELPVNGGHYEEANWREYPDEAYTLALAYQSHEIAKGNSWGKCPWRMIPDRPIFLGEAFYLRGERPAAYAQFGGEACFVGWNECKPGAGMFAKMLSEGYRWHNMAAFSFSLSDDQVNNYYNSWKEVIVLCREWNWTFAGSSSVERTLKVLNDTRYPDPIDMAWELTVKGKRVAGEKKTLNVAPGCGEELKITLPVPPVQDRTQGELLLTCSRGGKELFRDTKEIWIDRKSVV